MELWGVYFYAACIGGTPFVYLSVPDSRTKQTTMTKIETMCCLCCVFLEYKLVHFFAFCACFCFLALQR